MNIILIILILIIIFEYIGLGQYYPIINKISLILAISAFTWLVIKNGIGDLLKHKQTKIFLCFIVLSGLYLFYALVKTYVVDALKIQIGYFLLFGICYYVLNTYRRIKIILTILVIIHAILVFINIDQLQHAERYDVLRAGYFLGDGNDFSWSMAIVLPFAIYLFGASRNMIWKFGALGAIILILAGIITTQSRGAAIASFAAISFLSITSRRRMLTILLLVFSIFLVVVTFEPSKYIQRMQTVANYDEDSSAKGRLMVWRAAIEIALDNPFGIGPRQFPSVYGRYYRERFADHTVWSSGRWLSPHSIYFLILAEYGFLGLVLLLLLIYWNVENSLRRTGDERMTKKEIQDVSALRNTTCASVIAFSVGGIFLGGLNYPHIYIISPLTMGLTVIARRNGSKAETNI